jgi:hypothetical protein
VLDRATPAAWRVFTAPITVTVKYGGAVFTVKNNAGVAWFLEPGAARYGVEFDIVAGVYPGAAPAAFARVFCAHAFNCHI